MHPLPRIERPKVIYQETTPAGGIFYDNGSCSSRALRVPFQKGEQVSLKTKNKNYIQLVSANVVLPARYQYSASVPERVTNRPSASHHVEVHLQDRSDRFPYTEDSTTFDNDTGSREFLPQVGQVQQDNAHGRHSVVPSTQYLLASPNFLASSLSCSSVGNANVRNEPLEKRPTMVRTHMTVAYLIMSKAEIIFLFVTEISVAKLRVLFSFHKLHLLEPGRK